MAASIPYQNLLAARFFIPQPAELYPGPHPATPGSSTLDQFQPLGARLRQPRRRRRYPAAVSRRAAARAGRTDHETAAAGRAGGSGDTGRRGRSRPGWVVQKARTVAAVVAARANGGGRATAAARAGGAGDERDGSGHEVGLDAAGDGVQSAEQLPAARRADQGCWLLLNGVLTSTASTTMSSILFYQEISICPRHAWARSASWALTNAHAGGRFVVKFQERSNVHNRRVRTETRDEAQPLLDPSLCGLFGPTVAFMLRTLRPKSFCDVLAVRYSGHNKEQGNRVCQRIRGKERLWMRNDLSCLPWPYVTVE